MRVTKLLLVSVWSAFGLSDVKPNQSNHNGPSAKKENTQNSQRELKVKKANRLKRGKTRATKSWLISVLLPIGWESRASYLDQSQSEVRQNQCNPGKISILSLKLLERLFNWLGDEQFSQLPRTFLPDYVCVRKHQPRPQREEDWKQEKSTTENEITKSCHDNSIKSHLFLLPSPRGLGPVKHFVHGCHSFLSHRNNISTSHNTIIHPRMLGKALEDKC